MNNQLALFEEAQVAQLAQPVRRAPRGTIRVYRFAGVTTTCRKFAEEFSNGSEIRLVDEYPRPSWYKSKPCECCYDA